MTPLFKGSFTPRCEIFATTNEIDLSERVADRVKIIVFSNWNNDIDAKELAARSQQVIILSSYCALNQISIV